jgi:hypothetical protein
LVAAVAAQKRYATTADTVSPRLESNFTLIAIPARFVAAT